MSLSSPATQDLQLLPRVLMEQAKYLQFQISSGVVDLVELNSILAKLRGVCLVVEAKIEVLNPPVTDNTMIVTAVPDFDDSAGAFGFAAMLRSGAYSPEDVDMVAAKFDFLGATVRRLREDCRQAYQATGFIVDQIGFWNTTTTPARQQAARLLDNLAAAGDGTPRPHEDLLPFGWIADPPETVHADLIEIGVCTWYHDPTFKALPNSFCYTRMGEVIDAVLAVQRAHGIPAFTNYPSEAQLKAFIDRFDHLTMVEANIRNTGLEAPLPSADLAQVRNWLQSHVSAVVPTTQADPTMSSIAITPTIYTQQDWIYQRSGNQIETNGSVSAVVNDEAVIKRQAHEIVTLRRSLWTDTYQSRVPPLVVHVFGHDAAYDPVQRVQRFLEEVFELVQKLGCSLSVVYQIGEWVYAKPTRGGVGEEVGGVMNALAMLCARYGLNMHEEAEDELERMWGMIDKMRAKFNTKPVFQTITEDAQSLRTEIIATPEMVRAAHDIYLKTASFSLAIQEAFRERSRAKRR